MASLLTDFVMMVGLLRREMKQKHEFERYEGRYQRIEQKFAAFAEQVSIEDSELAKALHIAWQQPARALAFKNAEHQKQLKKKPSKKPNGDGDDNEPEDK